MYRSRKKTLKKRATALIQYPTASKWINAFANRCACFTPTGADTIIIVHAEKKSHCWYSSYSLVIYIYISTYISTCTSNTCTCSIVQIFDASKPPQCKLCECGFRYSLHAVMQHARTVRNCMSFLGLEVLWANMCFRLNAVSKLIRIVNKYSSKTLIKIDELLLYSS